MPTTTKQELLKLLRNNSFKRGEFILSSGAKSDIYFDCKLTTLDSYGIWKVGEVMLDMIRRSAMDRGVTIDSVGGLTLGADSIAQAVGMLSVKNGTAIQFFSVRKTPKSHGRIKLIEGSFKPGDTVVIIDDVITKGESTISAINAVKNEGGKIAFVAVLVDREEGGSDRIKSLGYEVVHSFTKSELIERKSGETAATCPVA